MSDNTENEDKITRKIGERVDFAMNIEEGSVKALGDGQFQCTVTTPSIDRMGESIDTQGISTDAYMQNPVVLYGHDYSALPIGKATKLSQFKNKIVATFQLAVKEYTFAQTVADLIKGGYLNAVSIGGVVKQMSEDYITIKALEMVEFSVVPVPANGEALITSRSLAEIGKPAEQVVKEYHDFQQKAYAKTLKGLDNDDLDRHIKSLEEVTTILKSARTEKEASDTPTKIVIRRAASKASYHSQEIIRITRSK